jgi:two-component system, OmpR family, response regulator
VPIPTIKKVLMADDDADIRKICNLSLSAVGKWQVVLAATGTEAVAKAKEEVPGLILLDVMMPGLDGVTAYHQIQEIPALKDVPVILITAKVQPEELEKYMELGVAGVIMKPFDPMRLPGEIMRLLTQHYEANSVQADAGFPTK